MSDNDIYYNKTTPTTYKYIDIHCKCGESFHVDRDLFYSTTSWPFLAKKCAIITLSLLGVAQIAAFIIKH